MDYKTIVDINGFIISKCEQYIEGKVLTLELKDGQQVVELCKGKFLKPKWAGTEWVETATQEELSKAYPTVQPTQEEITAKEVANLKIDNIKKDLVITNVLQTIASLKVEVMNLKGGNI
jgi:hypothetical protein